VQFLFIPPDKALRLGTPIPSPQERLTICRDFAATLAYLHDELGVVFGDINARNAVFRLDAEPTVMFVDCDAVRVRGDMAAGPQLNAPDWDPPEGASPLGLKTDLYKLGLFVLRCITPAAGSSVNTDPAQARGALDATGLAMLREALRGRPDDRPSAQAWNRYLRRALGEALDPPRLVGVDVDRTFVAAGEPITLTWTAEFADTIGFTGVGVPHSEVPGRSGSGTVVLHPTRTGTITVTARNPLDEEVLRVGPVGVFDLPDVHDLPVQLPRFTLPPPMPTALPEVSAILPPFTTVPILPPLPVAAFDPAVRPDPPSRPDPFEPAGPPPDFGFGPSAIPIDITAIMSGSARPPTADRAHERRK
jgi:hypothetical protein